MNERLKELLRAEIEAHELMPSTTPFLSMVDNTEKLLLSLLNARADEPDPSRPDTSIHELLRAIRHALDVYDQGNDHVPNHVGDDCVRCRVGEVVGFPVRPRRRRAS